jgi:hypothetical protein
MTKEHNNAIDAESYLSTQQRGIGRHPPPNTAAIETGKKSARNREKEGFIEEMRKGEGEEEGEEDEGEGEGEEGEGEEGEGEGKKENGEEGGIDAMVRAINGEDSNFQAKDIVDEIQSGTKSRVQREKSAAITNAASQMLR